MHIVIQSLLNHFLRRLKQGSNIHIKTHICESGCNNPRSPIVAVLPQLGDENAGPPSLLPGKRVHILSQQLKSLVLLICFAVHA